MSRFNIRDVSRDEAVVIAQLARVSKAEAMPYLPVLHSLEEDVEFYQTRVLPECRVTVAFSHVIVGFCASKNDWVEHLYVHPDHQRSGVGGLLLDFAKQDNNYLQLWTFQRNRKARAFYENRGFLAAELTDGQACDEKEPDVRYEWRAPRPNG